MQVLKLVLAGWVVLSMLAVSVTSAVAGEPASAPVPAKRIILDTASFWRTLHVLAPIVARVDGKVQVADTNMLCHKMSMPAKWYEPEFDDSGWTRQPGPLGGWGSSSRLSIVLMRGCFK